MGGSALVFPLLFLLLYPTWVCGKTELSALLDLKISLDPQSQYLSSWTHNGKPCGGSFEGVACNDKGQVTNISLQGKGLSGKLSPAIAGLEHLTGLYLHYNSLYGQLPKEISNLTELTDLYMNVNRLTGDIPHEIGNMKSLQVLQLCYNQFTGSIPTQLGHLNKLTVLALQSNQLTGAVPANLGNMEMLVRLDLSFNHLFGSIPSNLADAPSLRMLDVRNNALSGVVPPALKKLDDGFLYENNLGLCGVEFLFLQACNATDHIDPSRPEPFGPGSLPTRNIPETANVQLSCNGTRCASSSASRHTSAVISTIAVVIAVSAIGVLTFTRNRRQRQKLGSSFDCTDNQLSTDRPKGVYRKKGSPLINLEYPNGWDPLADGRSFIGDAQEHLQSYMFNLEEVETATQYFSESNLLRKCNFSATYKGVLRDGSVVAIKSISKTSCISDEAELLKGLNVMTSLRHENLLKLRGFCCSKGRGECFLIYDFVPNGNLSCYLDVNEGETEILEWSTRISIIKGIAKGIAYLHGHNVNKPAIVHLNISSENVFIDQRFNPLLSDSGLHKLLSNDIVFSALKARASMGYLSPEYTTIGRSTEKSDIYAFGIVLFHILSGKQKVTSSIRLAAESLRFQDFIDPNLHGRFFEYEAAKLAKMALLCTHDSPFERPTMEAIVQELSTCSSCL